MNMCLHLHVIFGLFIGHFVNNACSAKSSHIKGTARETIPSVAAILLTRTKLKIAKRDVAGHDVTVDPPYVVGGGKGKKKLATIFINNEALEEDEDAREAGTQTVEDGPGEEGEDGSYSGIDEEFLDVEEDDGDLAVTTKTSTRVGKSGTSCEVLVPFSPDWDISAKEAIVKGDDSDNMLPGFQEESSPEIVNLRKESSPSLYSSKLPNVSGTQNVCMLIAYCGWTIPIRRDYGCIEEYHGNLECADWNMWGVSKCGIDVQLVKTHTDAISLPEIEYSITGDVMQFALISCIWNKILRYNIIGHNILSLSRNPPPLFEWVSSKNIKSKCKLHLCSKGTNELVGGFMFGQVFSCNLKSKVMGDSNFIKPRIRSSISIVLIETKWEHVTSMLSMVTGDVKLAFPTYSQGLVFGTIAVDSGRASGAHLPVIEGLSSLTRGVSSNCNLKRSANLLKESLFANEIVPIYSTPKAGKLSWKDMTEWAQVENDPVVETPVCVIFTMNLYDPAGSNTANKISLNVQSVVILKQSSLILMMKNNVLGRWFRSS
ncbi:hypothetical protein K439DRAFT_1620608 [Ramaria rubella]|nr:hypothetical protein K439DRAFT_1620608 [Ramaria rubella]